MSEFAEQSNVRREPASHSMAGKNLQMCTDSEQVSVKISSLHILSARQRENDLHPGYSSDPLPSQAVHRVECESSAGVLKVTEAEVKTESHPSVSVSADSLDSSDDEIMVIS